MERKEKICVLPYYEVTRNGVEVKEKEYKIYFVSNGTSKMYSDWAGDYVELENRDDADQISNKEIRSLDLVNRRDRILLSILEDNGQCDIDMKFLDKKCKAGDISRFIGEATSKDVEAIEKKTLET